MEMEIEVKLNKLIFIITCILASTLCMALGVRLALGELGALGVIIRLMWYTLPTIIGTLIMKKTNRMHRFKYLMLWINIGILLMITSGGYGVFEFSITYTIFILFFLYNDKRVNRLLYVGIPLAAIGGGYIQYIRGAYPENLYGWNVGLLIVFIFTYRKIGKLLLEDTKIKNSNIANERAVQSKLIREILDIGNSIDENCNKVSSMSREIEESSQSINAAIEHVAIGAGETNVSIQSQIEMTNNIQDHISNAEEEFEKIKSIVEVTNTSCNRTRETMAQLNEKAKEANEVSIKTESIMKELKNETVEINHITGLIGSILKQTNLLSLNATIESARAGEYGKGFSVVADEIGQLAKQSQKLILDINEMIDKLEVRVETTIVEVNRLSATSKQQGELINNISGEFVSITEGMRETVNAVEIAGEKIKQVVESNQVIVNSINDISAVSEESSAATQEVSSMSNANTELIQMTGKYIKELSYLSEHMKDYKIQE